jgi:hypothetical protein
MSVGLDIQLMELMSEGVILLDRKCQMTDFNKAATPWVKHCLDSAPMLRQLIDSITQGLAFTPLAIPQLGLGLAANNQPDFFLCTTESKGYAIFIAQAPLPAPPLALQAQDTDLFQLLGKETRHELTLFRQMLSQTGTDQNDADKDLHQRSHRLSRLLLAFDQLAQLHQSNSFSAGDRLSLPTLVEEVVQDMQKNKCGYVMDVPTAEKLPVGSALYGDAQWLKCAVQVLLEGINHSAPNYSRVTLRIRQNGSYIMLSSHYCHEMTRSASVSPTRSVGSRRILQVDSDIGVQISRRIVEMHRGQLMTTAMPEDATDTNPAGIESFTLILPLSTPAHGELPEICQRCPTTLQAEQFANDLALLMPRSPAGAGLLDEELQMLAEISFPVSAKGNSPATTTFKGFS